MEIEQPAEQSTGVDLTPPAMSSTASRSTRIISPQLDTGTCATCGGLIAANADSGMMYPYVYAIGRIVHRFPTLGVEKEVAQTMGRGDTKGLTDPQAVADTLKQNRYLARRMCYVFTIGDLETYILQPRDPMDVDLLIEAIRPGYETDALDVVIGVRGPIASPEMCNGLMVPIVVFDQIYSFDRTSHRNAIPRSANVPEDQFTATADEVLARIMQMTDNAGATDEDRALNYLALRYDKIYAETANRHGGGESLSGIEVRTAPLAGTRKLVDVICTYSNRSTNVVDKQSARVDVTEEFPFLVTPLSPYLER